jgi:CHAT domain-containing protein
LADLDRLYVVGAWDPIDADPAVAARVAIAMLPSSRFLLEPKSSPRGRAVIVGDPNGDLPGSRREAESIPIDAVRLMGSAATRRAILAQIEEASLFHFAGHAQVVDASPWHASLEVADGSITLEDLLVVQPKVGLVVLSACSSGTGATRGEMGLPHAFLMSGARAVLATKRSLSDAAAGQFLRRFYEKRGLERPLPAFREAIEASVLAGDTTWTDFRLFGR